jgi:thiol-disulfide isomerase/thioredoxin
MRSLFKTHPAIAWSAVVLVGLVAVGLGFQFGREPDGGGLARARSDGAALLGVSLPDSSGREQSIGQWKGKVLIVNFWATWCVPCREEMPVFVQIQKEQGERGVQFVGIAVDDAAKVRDFAAELGLNYPTLIGGYGAIELSRSLGNRVGALPYTLVIDRAGNVSHAHLGPIKPADLRAIIGQLI